MFTVNKVSCGDNYKIRGTGNANLHDCHRLSWAFGDINSVNIFESLNSWTWNFKFVILFLVHFGLKI